MKVQPEQLLNHGFIILRNLIPSNKIETMRDSFEILVERQKTIWTQERKPEDPPGGVWEKARQPRLRFQDLIDESTANTVEFCLGENTLGISRQLLGTSSVAVQSFFFMCNPVRDHGPAHWHRDIQPNFQAPLCGLTENILNYGPAYVQWNIPLYDDNVLWIVPGSHLRQNTDAENRQLLNNHQIPLPNSIPVKLKAGDGVVYSNLLLHWPSSYSPTLRRTIHLGYRSFGGSIFPYGRSFYWDSGFEKHLAPWARETIEQFEKLLFKENRIIVSIFRAMIDKNVASFNDGLAKLHSGEKGKMVCIILLSKLAHKICFKLHPGKSDLEDKDNNYYYDRREEITRHFSSSELEILWQRFSTLDSKLQSETQQFIPGFQSQENMYFFNNMPINFEVKDFMSSWNN